MYGVVELPRRMTYQVLCIPEEYCVFSCHWPTTCQHSSGVALMEPKYAFAVSIGDKISIASKCICRGKSYIYIYTDGNPEYIRYMNVPSFNIREAPSRDGRINRGPNPREARQVTWTLGRTTRPMVNHGQGPKSCHMNSPFVYSSSE